MSLNSFLTIIGILLIICLAVIIGLVILEAVVQIRSRYHCEVCGKHFELKDTAKYIVRPFLAGKLECFDCPHCGCQNIVGVHKEDNQSNCNEIKVGDLEPGESVDIEIGAVNINE